MRRAAITLVLCCASCRAVFGLEPPLQVSDAQVGVGDANIDVATDARLATCSSDTNLVACFDFEGAVIDLAPSPNSVLSANVAYEPNGTSGQALRVDQASRVRITDSVLLDIPEVTIEAWIRLTEAPPSLGRVGVVDVNGQYGMFVKDGYVLSCTVGVNFDVGIVPADKWTHVACTAANGMSAGYINGTAMAVAVYSGSLPTIGMDGGEIAGESPNGGDRLVGNMDLLRIYRIARGSEQICLDAGEPGCL